MKPLFLLFLILPVLARAESPSEADLDKLKDRIETLSAEQQREAEQRDDLQTRLRETETRVGELAREGRRLEREGAAPP
ncbi:hypothetical protein B27N_02123, partial [Alcanivorax marinus]|nr:hypothetical protein [Alloalcanivorax marinus]